MTGDDDTQMIPPLGASWAGARAAGRPRLWCRGYRGEGRDRLLTRESVGWAGSGPTAGRVPGGPR